MPQSEPPSEAEGAPLAFVAFDPHSTSHRFRQLSRDNEPQACQRKRGRNELVHRLNEKCLNELQASTANDGTHDAEVPIILEDVNLVSDVPFLVQKSDEYFLETMIQIRSVERSSWP